MTTSVPTTRPPIGGGWRLWYAGIIQETPPYYYAEVEIWRRGWKQTELVEPNKLDPMSNVANLYWRPAGPLVDRAAVLRRAPAKRNRK